MVLRSAHVDPRTLGGDYDEAQEVDFRLRARLPAKVDVEQNAAPERFGIDQHDLLHSWAVSAVVLRTRRARRTSHGVWSQRRVEVTPSACRVRRGGSGRCERCRSW